MVALHRELPNTLSPRAHELLNRIGSAFKISQTKALKEAMQAVREAGGLLGRIVCVRKANLPEEVLQFASQNHIELVMKSELANGFKSLLFPDRPVTAADLASLVEKSFHRH